MSNLKPVPKKRTTKEDPVLYVRKIAERDETIEFDVLPEERDELGRQVLILLDEEDRIERMKDEASKNFASQLKTNRLQIDEMRGVIKEGKRRTKLHIVEWLTKQNEVVKIRADTGEPVGKPRTATPRELQEEMFQEEPDAKPETPGEIVDDDPFGGAPT